MGHLLGAAGSVEALISILALKNSCIPPTINLTNQDEKCDLDFTPLVPKSKKLVTVFQIHLVLEERMVLLYLKNINSY